MSKNEKRILREMVAKLRRFAEDDGNTAKLDSKSAGQWLTAWIDNIFPCESLRLKEKAVETVETYYCRMEFERVDYSMMRAM
jgi:hypothetical protein